MKAESRAFGFRLVAHHVGEAHLAFQQPLDGHGDLPGAPLFVLGLIELALELNGVERHAVARGRDLRIDDIGAGAGASASHHGKQPRVVRRKQRDLGDAAEGVGGDMGDQRLALGFGGADQLGVLGDDVEIGPEPIGGIVAVDEALELRLRPVGEALAQGILGARHALGAG